MERTYQILFVGLFAIWTGIMPAQTQQSKKELGQRFLRNYDPNETNGRIQNWDLLKDERGILYVANGAGVLEYDGVQWRIISLPNQAAALSLALGNENRIYLGGSTELGYLAPDSTGNLSYRSLKRLLPDSLLDFRYVWDVRTAGTDVFFEVNQNVLQFDQQTHQLKKVWQSPGNFDIETIDGQLYMWRSGLDWGRLEGDSLVKLGSSNNIYERGFVLPPFQSSGSKKNDELAIRLANRPGIGPIAIYKDGRLENARLGDRLNTFLENNSFSFAYSLGDSGYLLIIPGGGAILMDKDGKAQEPINQEGGLKNDLILKPFLDENQTLWLGTEFGLTSIEPFSPFSFLGTEKLGAVVSGIIRHQGELYVGTSKGVFRLLPAADLQQQAQFEEVCTLPDVFGFFSDGDDLFVGVGGGVYQINANKRIPEKQVVRNPTDHYFIQPSIYDSTIWYLGTNEGVSIVKRRKGSFQLQGSIEMGGLCRSLVETAPDTLWMGSDVLGLQRFVSKGNMVDLVAQSKGNTPIPGELSSFGEEQGIPQGLVYTWRLAGRMVITTTQGYKRYDQGSQSFVPETYFGSEMADKNLFTYLTTEDSKGRIYTLTNFNTPGPSQRVGISQLTPDKATTYTLEKTLFHRLPQTLILGAQVLYSDPSNPDILWMATGDQLVRFDASKAVPTPDSFPVHLRRIKTARDSVIYYNNVGSANEMELKYEMNNLRFEFAASFFQNEEETQYQIMLEGFDEDWTDWSDETYADYTNLSEGTYYFRVKARNIAYTISESPSFKLVVLPPWYRSWWAYASYIALGILLLVLVSLSYNRWRLRRVLAKNLELETIIEIRTEEINGKNQELEKALSSLKTTQDQLIMQEKMASLGQMTAGIAHEIKNPLNFVTNFARGSVGLLEDFKDELEEVKESLPPTNYETMNELLEDVRKHTQKIQGHGKRADAIVSSMMRHADNRKGQRKAASINPLLKDSVSLASQGYLPETPGFKLDVTYELDETLPLIEINEREMGRVIINIVNNACYALDQKASERGLDFTPELKILSSQDDTHVTIHILDNGPGIADAVKGSIFNPFFTTKPTGKGYTGLGLSISFDIITQAYQGILSVESEEGSYTKFEIRLPK